MTPAEFAELQRLPPAEAMAYMAGRGFTAETYHWYELWKEEHGRAFTVSRLTRADLLEAMQESLAKSVAGDLTRRDWIRGAEKLLKAEGWWGTKEVTDPRTGEVLKTKFNHARLQLIYDTNTRQAAAAGQWQRLLRTQRTHPYVRYVAINDERTRPLHRAWHNVTLPITDSWWETHRPPNGYRCRCRVVGVTRAEYEQGGTKSRPGAEDDGAAPLVNEPMRKKRPADAFTSWRNPDTGEVLQVPAGIDPGFDHNAGTKGRSKAFEEMVQAKLARLAPALRAAALAEGMAVPRVARELAGQDTWKTLALPDLREMAPGLEAPALLPGAASVELAVDVLREVLQIAPGSARFVETPTGTVALFDRLLPHVVEKRSDMRERYARFILPTLEAPDEVWQTAYDDASTRRRYIKLFSDAKYDLLVVVREGPDGSVLWNVINRDRKGMNALRVGRLVHQAGK